MGMPRNLLLVRHGQSEGNVILKDDSLVTPEFLARHSSQWRLTPLGVEQAAAAGKQLIEIASEWLMDDYRFQAHLVDDYLSYLFGDIVQDEYDLIAAPNMRLFDRYYTSPFLRAIETSANLGIRDAQWMINNAIYERVYGDLDRAQKADYGKFRAEKKQIPMHSKPPNGESIAEMCVTRLHGVLGTLSRECDGKDVAMVCHGEVMEGFAVTIERKPEHEYVAWLASDDPTTDTRNGQINQYSTVNPYTGEISEHLDWKRTFVPLEPERGHGWVKIDRPRYSNTDLLRMLDSTPALIG
jgi:broad specificity phosphatase PhoE